MNNIKDTKYQLYHWYESQGHIADQGSEWLYTGEFLSLNQLEQEIESRKRLGFRRLKVFKVTTEELDVETLSSSGDNPFPGMSHLGKTVEEQIEKNQAAMKWAESRMEEIKNLRLKRQSDERSHY